MNDCYNMIYMRAKRKDLKFSIENDPQIPAFLYGDEVRIRQIIMNLLTNAVKYTKDGSVTLKFDFENTDEDNINLIISVKDTGIGMSHEVGSHIFEKFYQGDTSHSSQGNGLGLALVKRVIDITGSDISVSSQVGCGTEFTVKIPLGCNG